MNDKIKGFALGAIAAATYGMNPLFTLPLYSDGMDPDSVLFFRYLFAIPMLAAMILVRGRSFKVSCRDIPMLIFMGLIGEYIGRIYMCINETPQYVIKDIVKSEDKKERP